MSKFSQAVKKMNKAESPKHRLDHHTSDSPRVTQLKQDMTNLAEKVRKEGIQ